MSKDRREEIEICNCNVIHKDNVEKVKDNMLDDDVLIDIAELLKVFGDSTRIKIINALSYSEMCVCDLAYTLNMTQSSISHQLRILKRERLVKYRKEGKMVYYSLDDDHVNAIFKIALEHVKE